MIKDAKPFLLDMLESIEKIEKYMKSIKKEEFFEDTQLQDSVIRRLEIIGEATKNIPTDFRNKYPDTPWKQVAGFRDILIHAYFGVKIERIWEIIKYDRPERKKKIKTIWDELKKED